MTTDQYIDKFLPFKMVKEMGDYLTEILDKDAIKKIKLMEKDRVR